MKIIVKVLQGQEHTLDVTGQSSVIDVKEQLDKLLSIPVTQQKLLLMGRPLSDDKCLCDYPAIKDGTKLNLIVKPATEDSCKQETRKQTEKTAPLIAEKLVEPDLSILREAAYKFLRDFYTESETQRIVEEFGKEFLRSVSTLSLDDYERIATSCLEEERNS